MQPIPQASPPSVLIGDVPVGPAHPPVFWPDIDVYFRRDERQARDLVDAIAASGGGFLKGAVLHRADLCLADAGPIGYFDHRAGQMVHRPYRDLIEAMVVPLPMLERLCAHAASRGLQLVLSVYDREGIAFARDSGAVALKIPSSNITHRRLIEAAAGTGLPLVMDTGRSLWEEIERAVGWAARAGAGGRLLLQHSPPGPPAAPERFHMRMLGGLSRRFGCPVGLSDHHAGLDMVPIAIALGACAIEKGVVADTDEAGIDRAHALDVRRLRETLDLMHASWQALGHDRRPATEVPTQAMDRMGCVSASTLPAHHVLREADIGFAFPAVGIAACDVDSLVGRRLRHALATDQPITAADLEPGEP